MWAERPATAAQLRAGASELSQALSRAELQPGEQSESALPFFLSRANYEALRNAVMYAAANSREAKIRDAMNTALMHCGHDPVSVVVDDDGNELPPAVAEETTASEVVAETVTDETGDETAAA